MDTEAISEDAEARIAPPVQRRRPRGLGAVLRRLGPGLITGAADDDPSGIATYAQIGAQFGYSLGWTVVLTTPVMIGVQEISARIGRVSGAGLAAALRAILPGWTVAALVSLLVVANVINLGADIGAMASCLKLLAGGPERLYAIGFAVVCALAEIWLAYKRYVMLLKWLTLSLLAYVGLLLVVRLPLAEVATGLLVPRVGMNRAALTGLVALLGTTISPYLFFWQASQEAEDESGETDSRPLRLHPGDAKVQVRRIALDTTLGMILSNIVAASIIVGTAATLHARGVTQINTAADAAQALKPVAGDFAAAVFAAGVIGTGLLAVPVLAGSAAYAVGEALRWKVGLSRRALEARGFYAVLALATLVGAGIVFSPIDPIKALYWSAVVNGVISAPMIAAMTAAASSRRIMGELTLPAGLKLAGWLAAILMLVPCIGMFLT